MDFDDIIDRLCMTAGVIMEDASVSAISVGVAQRERVVALLRASDAISVVAKAADALNSYQLSDL